MERRLQVIWKMGTDVTDACWTDVSSLSRTLAKMKLPVPVIARSAERNLEHFQKHLKGALSVRAHVTNKEVRLKIETHQNRWAVMGSRMTQEAATPMLMLTK